MMRLSGVSGPLLRESTSSLLGFRALSTPITAPISSTSTFITTTAPPRRFFSAEAAKKEAPETKSYAAASKAAKEKKVVLKDQYFASQRVNLRDTLSSLHLKLATSRPSAPRRFFSTEATATEATESAPKEEREKVSETKSDAAAPEAKEKQLSAKEQLEADLAKLEQQAKEHQHKILLSLADFENERKRMMQETDGRKARAKNQFATSLMPVVEQIENLVSHSQTLKNGGGAAEEVVETDGTDSGSPGEAARLQQLLEGVEMTRDILMKTLEKHGVEKQMKA